MSDRKLARLSDDEQIAAVLAVEAVLIGLFALFWSIQTVELWHEGLR
jgi:hypothetical protein